VNTLLVDPPPVSDPEQPSSPASAGAPPAPVLAPPPSSERACANCGAPLNAAQDWCLQCGVGAPGSLAARAPSWRSAATILGATALLAAGAATAAYAALSEDNGKARPVTATVAQTPAPTTLPVTPTTPGALPPTTPNALGTPTTARPILPLPAAKPPKIPLAAAKPKSSDTTTTPSTSAGGTTIPSTTPTKSTGGATPTTTEPQPAAILLDTDAAATYNPYGYPSSDFGDPSLAIDGDTSTGWTAQVDPAVAPKMAEGLVIDLKTPQRLSALALVTSTPGMTVQVYGANGQTLPTSITDPAWVQLSPFQVEKKKRVRIKLAHPGEAFRFVTLWISGAPASSIGTLQAPGHVSVNELELFPAK
jgi:hypothetical protein